MDKVIGSVNKIVYYNESNGYGIIKLKIDFRNSINASYQNILFSNSDLLGFLINHYK